MARISARTAESLKAIMNSQVTKPNGIGIPGLSCSVRNREGSSVFEYAAGKRGQGFTEPMTGDSVLWIASCTKLITSIAAMQLVEQGRLSLDNADELEDRLPELKDKKVLQEAADGSLELHEKKRKITLRMLLTHTGMLMYPFYLYL